VKFFQQIGLHRKQLEEEARREQAWLVLTQYCYKWLGAHALIKMVCTWKFTFQTSPNERRLPNAL